MIGGPARRLGHDTVEAKLTQIDRIHESIDHPNGIVFVDPVVQALGKQGRLAAIGTFDKAPHPIPQQTARESYHRERFHTARGHDQPLRTSSSGGYGTGIIRQILTTR